LVRLLDGLATGRADHQTIMNDATNLKAQRTASSLRAKKGGDAGRLIGRTRGGMNTNLHAMREWSGRPLNFFMTAGLISDYTGATALLGGLSAAKWLLAVRGYRGGWFMDGLVEEGMTPHIQSRKSRTAPVSYDRRKY